MLRKIMPLALLAAFSVNSHAALVTETWESTVTYVTHTAFVVGDTFQWTITYDNESQRMSSYNDGANGVAESGAGDDTFYYSHCTTAYAGSEPCTYPGYNSYSFFSDAVFDLTGFTSVMSTAGYMGGNVYSHNYAWAYDTTSGVMYRQYIADDLQFIGGTFGGEYAYTYDSNDRGNSTRFTSVLISTTEQVPEPATLALMGLGLAGIGFARKKKAA
ncbi:MAG: PEP-CTERM sorting domain-containing protein [Sedimenticola sp.]